MELSPTSKIFSKKYVVTKNIILESINNETYFLNVEKGKFFSSNDTASFILRYLEKPRLIVDVLGVLEGKFIDFDKQDALSFIKELIKSAVIEEANEEN